MGTVAKRGGQRPGRYVLRDTTRLTGVGFACIGLRLNLRMHIRIKSEELFAHVKI